MKPVLSNVDAIYAEYPFLEAVLPRKKVSTLYQRGALYVKRWDKDILNQGNFDQMFTYEYCLLDERGQVVTRLGKRCFGLLTSEETVGEALVRLGVEAHRVRYALDMGPNTTFYKLPKGFANAADWLKSVVEEG